MLEHVLISDRGWGPMNEVDAKRYSDEQMRIFPCGGCSDNEIQVYHNVVGQHLHQHPERTKKVLMSEIQQGRAR